MKLLSARKVGAVLLCSFALVSVLFTGQFSGVRGAGSAPAFDNVVIIILENNGLADVCGSSLPPCANNANDPYMTSLANTNGLALNYNAISHPSEGNYISLIGGDNFGHVDDGYCCYGINAPNIIDRIEAAGKTWKAFAEDAANSGQCSFDPPRGADHFGFKTFSDMNTPARCANFLTTTSPSDPEFISILNSATPPSYLWLTPNDNDNGHDSSISVSDSYLSTLVPQILGSTTFTTKNAALFITYDEGNDSCPVSNGNDCLYTVWAGPVAKKGYTSSNQYSHYSLLKTIETAWNLQSLTSNDAGASPMTEYFTGNSAPSGGTGGLSTTTWLLLAALVVGLVGGVIIYSVKSRSRKRPRNMNHSKFQSQ